MSERAAANELVPNTPGLLARVCGGLLLVLLGFRVFDWGSGVYRAGLVALLIAGILLIPHLLRYPLGPGKSAVRTGSLALVAALGLLAVDGGLGIYSVVHTARTGDIRLDQGQNTYRAALLLLRGENPYGRGQLLDLEAFETRRELRKEAGVDHRVSDDALDGSIKEFWSTLDPKLRSQLLPLPAPSASPLAVRETSVLGYKYGPVLFLLALPLTKLLGPAAIPLLNLVAFLSWMGVLWALLRSTALPKWTHAIILGSILATFEIPWNFLIMTASDIWPLLFSSVALLAFFRNRPALLGIALGLGLGSKLFPTALFLPLLFLTRPLLSLGCAALVAAGLYVPFFIWDPQAFLLNVVRWPSLMAPDSTGWVFYAPASVVPIVRGVVVLGLAIVSWRLVTRREEYLFRALALSSLLIVLGGGSFHNNYVTWFVPWLFCAVAEALTATKTLHFREAWDLPEALSSSG